MSNLNFDTGLITYTLNDTCEVRFNPTDSSFVQRLADVFDVLEKKQECYHQEVAALKEPGAIFEFARARDAEMREIIDGLFGPGVSDALFGGMNVYALAGGLPVWCNLMLAVMDEINEAFTREQKATNPRIKTYLERYRK